MNVGFLGILALGSFFACADSKPASNDGGMSDAHTPDASTVTVATPEQLEVALLAATPGTVVRLAAGTFDRAIEVPAGVTLVGDGASTLIRASGGQSVIRLGDGAALENLRVEGEGTEHVVAAVGSGTESATVRDVEILFGTGNGLFAVELAALALDGVVVLPTDNFELPAGATATGVYLKAVGSMETPATLTNISIRSEGVTQIAEVGPWGDLQSITGATAMVLEDQTRAILDDAAIHLVANASAIRVVTSSLNASTVQVTGETHFPNSFAPLERKGSYGIAGVSSAFLGLQDVTIDGVSGVGVFIGTASDANLAGVVVRNADGPGVWADHAGAVEVDDLTTMETVFGGAILVSPTNLRINLLTVDAVFPGPDEELAIALALFDCGFGSVSNAQLSQAGVGVLLDRDGDPQIAFSSVNVSEMQLGAIGQNFRMGTLLPIDKTSWDDGITRTEELLAADRANTELIPLTPWVLDDE